MLLPAQPTRDWVRSLAVTLAALCLVVGVAALVASWWVVAIAFGGFALGCAATAVLANRGFRAYEGYVGMTQAFARVVRAVMQFACFAVVTAAGRPGTTLVTDAPRGGSMWSAKASIAPEAYRTPYVSPNVRSKGWIRNYLAWARATGNRWAILLLPFLVVLRSAQEQTDHEVRGEIYTLY